MKTSSAKAKGRKLQVQVAEALARRFNLTIEASPPTKTGVRNGVKYVGEDTNADLRVRRMGQAGLDVLQVSQLAQTRVAMAGVPVAIECKCAESFQLGALFWREGRCEVVTKALRQLQAAKPKWVPAVVVAKNNWPTLVAWLPYDHAKSMPSYDGMYCWVPRWGLCYAPLDVWMGQLDGCNPIHKPTWRNIERA